jgi:phosphoribosylformylglycinamidine synthase
MDVVTTPKRYFQSNPEKNLSVEDIDESEEKNACSFKVTVEMEDETKEEWLIMYKNETHNHPTEIEPFG